MADRFGEPRYRLVAEEAYRQNLDRTTLFLKLAADYGKWLTTTLTTVNAASIYGLATLHAPYRVFWPFVWGLILSLGLGFSTWVNLSLGGKVLIGYSQPNMLIDAAHWPEESKLNTWATTATFRLSIILGVLSAVCILWGAAQFLT